MACATVASCHVCSLAALGPELSTQVHLDDANRSSRKHECRLGQDVNVFAPLHSIYKTDNTVQAQPALRYLKEENGSEILQRRCCAKIDKGEVRQHPGG